MPGEPRKRKGWPSTHQHIFPGQEQKSTPLRPSLPAPSPGCSLPTSSAREDGEGSQVTVTVQSFTERRDAGWCELHGSPRTLSLIDVPVPASPPRSPDDICTGCCMKPFPGPGQCSLHSSLGAAGVGAVRAGREDADSWEPGGLVTGSLESSTSSRPPPHLRTHRPVCTCRGIHTCAEMWLQMLVPDASPAVCTSISGACLRETRQQCKAQPFPSCPPLQLVGLAEQDWPGGAPPTPFSWAVPAGAQY